MSVSDPRKRVDALLLLAGGKSQRATAAEVGVGPGTVARWRKEPEFGRELAGLRELLGTRPSGEVLMEAVERIAARLESGPQVDADGRVRVVVSIPAGASAKLRRRLIARGVAQVLERGEGGLR